MVMLGLDATANLTLALLQIDAHMHPRPSRLNHTHGQSIPTVQQKMDPVGHFGPAAEAIQGTFMIAGVDTGMESTDLFGQLSMPLVALVLGLCLYTMKAHQLTARLILFFGAQSFMNLYMKIVLSHCVVSKRQGYVGIPAPFIVTGLQQLVGFVVMMCMVGISAFKPRPLQTKADIISILALSVTFTLNIALNNFSMALLDLSVNLMIRSSAPLTTYLCQVVASKMMGTAVKAKHVKSTVLLIIGVGCGALVVYAKSEAIGHAGQHGERKHLYLGLTSAFFSLLSAALEVNVVGIMGTGTRLNALEACCYMAVPSALQLWPAMLFWEHPVSWAGRGNMTDFDVLREIYALHPRLILLVFLSGLFALAYNAMLYTIIQHLSPAHAAVASNFNKMAVIAIAYVLGIESLPRAPWNALIVLGVLGNGFFFAGFGYIEAVQPAAQAAETKLAAEKIPVAARKD